MTETSVFMEFPRMNTTVFPVSTSLPPLLHGNEELPTSSLTSSTFHLSVACLLVFVLSPVIICSNGLLLACLFRYRKLRNASNDFVLCLCVVDLSIGVLLPLGLYYEVSRYRIDCAVLCLVPVCVLLMLCSVSMLNMSAIALDRYISLAFPLQYTNIMTHRSVAKYVVAFWLYSLLVSSTPIVVWFATYSDTKIRSCSFATILPSARYFLVFALYVPCACIILSCYSYVYVVARGHARAIFSVEASFRGKQHKSTMAESRYGRTLAVTVGAFFLCWLPFVASMTVDAFSSSDPTLSQGNTCFYFGLLVLANSAANPWIYGYRNSEIRRALLKILRDVLPKLTHTLQHHQAARARPVPTAGYPSCASHLGLIATHHEGGAVVTELHPGLSTTNYLQVPDTFENTCTCTSSQVFNLTSPGYAEDL